MMLKTMMLDKLITAAVVTIAVMLFAGIGEQAKNPSALALESYQIALRLVPLPGTPANDQP